MKSKILISNISNLQLSVQMLFEPYKIRIKECSSVLIQIDLSFPQTYPVTINPEFLYYVIKTLFEFGVKQISVVGGSLSTISPKKVWDSLGFNTYISSQFPLVQFIPLDGNQEKSEYEMSNYVIEYPKMIEKAELFISIVNPKISMFNLLSMAIESSKYLIGNQVKTLPQEYNDPHFCENDLYLKKYNQIILESHLIHPPDLVIYDFSVCLSRAGPLLYKDSSILYSHMSMISDNSIIGDYVAFRLIGLDPNDSPLVEYIKNFDYSLLSDEQKSRFEISLYEDNENHIQERDVSFLLSGKEKEQEEEEKKRFWSKKSYKKDKIIPKVSGHETFINITEIWPNKTEICKGVMCSGCKKAATEMLLLLKTCMIKDQETLPQYSVLLGKNPIEPSNEYCIIFGDCAIESTKDRRFRKIIVKSKIRSERDIDLERARLKIRIQKQEVELQKHYDFIIHEIPEGKKRERAKKRLTQKINRMKRFGTYRMQLQHTLQNRIQKREKKREKNPLTKLNPNILEISGCPPDGFAYLNALVKFFKRRWTPGLTMRKVFLEDYIKIGSNNFTDVIEDSVNQQEMKG